MIIVITTIRMHSTKNVTGKKMLILIGLSASGFFFLNHSRPPTVAPINMYSVNMVILSSTNVSSMKQQIKLNAD